LWETLPAYGYTHPTASQAHYRLVSYPETSLISATPD